MSRTTGIILVAVVVLAVVAGVFIVLHFQAAAPGTPPSGAAPGALTQPGAHPTPVEEVFHGCPGQGDGTDPDLNLLKNRVDTGAWQEVPVAQLLALRWPKSVENRRMTQWSPADRNAVAPSNGLPVRTEGYLLQVRQEGPESPNCHSTDDLDFHMWFAASPSDPRATKSVVIEITPRIRAKHASWTLAGFQDMARQRTRVRIAGWTMLDPEHPEEIGKSRGTIWEIHPVMQIEVAQPGGGWKELVP